jgi:CheY-like chemotaxis protein
MKKHLSVLIVDDKNTALEGIANTLRIFKNYTFAIQEAEGYGYALKLLEEKPNSFDIAIIDYDLEANDKTGKKYTGVELVKEINKKFPSRITCFVLLTAYYSTNNTETNILSDTVLANAVRTRLFSGYLEKNKDDSAEAFESFFDSNLAIQELIRRKELEEDVAELDLYPTRLLLDGLEAVSKIHHKKFKKVTERDGISMTYLEKGWLKIEELIRENTSLNYPDFSRRNFAHRANVIKREEYYPILSKFIKSLAEDETQSNVINDKARDGEKATQTINQSLTDSKTKERMYRHIKKILSSSNSDEYSTLFMYNEKFKEILESN